MMKPNPAGSNALSTTVAAVPPEPRLTFWSAHFEPKVQRFT
jgi:hypothetical protein